MHLIFSTKNREPFLEDKHLRENLHAYLAGICNKMDSRALIVGGVADHVHILCNLSKKVALKDLIQHIKGDSSKWIKEKRPNFAYFYWQLGYGAFSVSPTHLEDVHHYIATQEEHHATVSFQDEFRAFLKRYQIHVDEQYLWD